MDFGLRGRIIVVTGGASGIGLAAEGLVECERALGRAVDTVGGNADAQFADLVDSVVAQQLSTKAANTISARLNLTAANAVLLDSVVSVEPDGQWPLVDLTAVLSTRARLYTERATWESGADRDKTLGLARAVYERLAVSPFIAVSSRSPPRL